MKRRKEVEFPSRGELVFEPGGRHAMLFGLSPKVKAGDRIPLTFSFNVAPPVTVDAEVRGAGGRGSARGALRPVAPAKAGARRVKTSAPFTRWDPGLRWGDGSGRSR